MTTISTNAMPRQAKSVRQWAIGGAVRSVFAHTEVRIVFGVVLALLLWAVAIATWGYPALIIPVLCMVPAMFVFLMMITVGK